jgi:hypothetical protein
MNKKTILMYQRKDRYGAAHRMIAVVFENLSVVYEVQRQSQVFGDWKTIHASNDRDTIANMFEEETTQEEPNEK